MYSHCGNKRTQDEMLEEIRKQEIYAKFGVYSSSIERLAIKMFERQESDQKNDAMKPRNFTLYFEVKDTSIFMHPCHFHYNGSWECLEEEMKRDAEMLNNKFGFKINYEGHDPEFDIKF